MGWRRGQAYSQDIRDRSLSALGSAAAVGERLSVSASYVIKARARRDRTGEMSARPQRSHTPAKLSAHDEALRAQLRQVPDATLAEMVKWAGTVLSVSVGVTTMWKRLQRLGLTAKKRRSSPVNSRGPMLLRRAATGTN